jgi:hypothetical protein
MVMAGKQYVTAGFHGNRYAATVELLEAMLSITSTPRQHITRTNRPIWRWVRIPPP